MKPSIKDYFGTNLQPNTIAVTYLQHEFYLTRYIERHLSILGVRPLVLSAIELNEITMGEDAKFLLLDLFRGVHQSKTDIIHGEVIDIYIDINQKNLFRGLRGKISLRNEGLDSRYVLGPSLCRSLMDSCVNIGDYIAINGQEGKVYKNIKGSGLESLKIANHELSCIEESETFSSLQLESTISRKSTLSEITPNKYFPLFVIHDAQLLNCNSKSFLKNILGNHFCIFLLFSSPFQYGITHPSISLDSIIDRNIVYSVFPDYIRELSVPIDTDQELKDVIFRFGINKFYNIANLFLARSPESVSMQKVLQMIELFAK